MPPRTHFSGAAGFNSPEGSPKWTFEALTGFRAWTVTPKGELASPMFKRLWTAGENQAEHRPYYGPDAENHDPCPTRDCSAGFYAYHSEAYWYIGGGGGRVSSPWVSGLIAGWGRVVNGPKGFRCAKATIMALCLPIRKPEFPDSLPQVVQYGSWDAWADFATDRIREQFPIVPVFDSVEDMLARVPLEGAA